MPASIVATKSTHRAGAPTGDARISGETPLPQYTATGVAGVLVWSDNGAGGAFSPSANANPVTYTPANESKSVVITASDSGTPRSTTLDVLSSFPLQPDFGYDADIDDRTEVSYAEDDTPFFLEQADPRQTWSVKCTGRTRADAALVDAHWRYHRKARAFYYVDDELAKIVLVRYDSKLGWRIVSANSNDLAALMREA